MPKSIVDIVSSWVGPIPTYQDAIRIDNAPRDVAVPETVSAKAPSMGAEANVVQFAADDASDTFQFVEGFETVTQVQQLASNQAWTSAQLVRGSIALSKAQAHSGDSSLHMKADNNIGKAHLYKSGYWEKSGDFVEASAWYWFPKNVSLDDVYIMDWESKSVWSSANSAHNTQPGIRIGLYGKDGYLAVDRSKMGIGAQADFVDRDFKMPRGEWVHLEWRMKLGVGKAGYTEVEVNDETIISASGTTYIDPAVAKQRGIKMNSDYAFDRFKVGLTANSSAQKLEAYIDDVGVSTWAAHDVPDWF
jgi:hypothetical protein